MERRTVRERESHGCGSHAAPLPHTPYQPQPSPHPAALFAAKLVQLRFDQTQNLTHSLNMNATSAVIVPSAGSPDSRNDSRSIQLRTKGSFTVASSTLLNGPVSLSASAPPESSDGR